MNLRRTFLFLTLMLILLSIVSQELAAETYVFLALSPVLVFVVWFTESANKPFRVPNSISTLLMFIAFVLVMFRGIETESLSRIGMIDVNVSAVGKFLILFQWISLFREKTPRDYAWIYLVTVVQMGIAGLLMPSPLYGLLLLGYALIGIMALTVLHLWSRAHAAGADMEHDVLVTRGLLLSAVPMTAALIPPLVGLFMVLPRWEIMLGAAGAGPSLASRPVAGFSNVVALGSVGSIQDNPTRVLTVAARNPETDQPIHLSEMLLRGIALDTYTQEGDVWTWQLQELRGDRKLFPYYDTAEDVAISYRPYFPEMELLPYTPIRLDVSIERMSTRWLFTAFAVDQIGGIGPRRLVANEPMNTFQCSRPPPTPFDYTVTCRILGPPPPGDDTKGLVPDWRLERFLQLPDNLNERVKALAKEIAPATLTPIERAKKIYNYLSDEKRFAYTLNQNPTPGVEPVEDFLFNRHIGHCEYFASAMAILLRCADVPCRVVNGFKASEYDSSSNVYIVRQSNAHSWVEAYLPRYGWLTFDPSVQRDAVTEKYAPHESFFGGIYDAIERNWNRYVVGYSAESQQRLAQAFVRVADHLRFFWEMSIAYVGGELLGLEKIPWRGVVEVMLSPLRIVAMVLGAAVILIVGLAGFRDARAWWRSRETRASITYYRKMEAILARRGFRRRRSETPWEFHSGLLKRARPEATPAEVITESFCRVRYGGRTLTHEELTRVDEALRSIRAMKVSRM